jgi:hypothetical protein
VAEVARNVAALGVDTVIFDDELSPGQLRNLEKAFSAGGREARVADRTALILDIFSQRARTREGMLQARGGWGGAGRAGRLGARAGPGARRQRRAKAPSCGGLHGTNAGLSTAIALTRFPIALLLSPYPPPQVELAQTDYQLPRLTRMWTHLDRVAGGGQVKGAGEKQIEIDKRLLRDKAAGLRRWGRPSWGRALGVLERRAVSSGKAIGCAWVSSSATRAPQPC